MKRGNAHLVVPSKSEGHGDLESRTLEFSTLQSTTPVCLKHSFDTSNRFQVTTITYWWSGKTNRTDWPINIPRQATHNNKFEIQTLLILNGYLAAMLRIANTDFLSKFKIGSEALADGNEERSPRFLSRNCENRTRLASRNCILLQWKHSKMKLHHKIMLKY